MTQKVIDNQLFEIVAKYAGRERTEKLWHQGDRLLLTGEAWGLSALDMVYIFLEIGKNFEIEVNTSQIMEYQFGSIAGIKRCIKISCCGDGN